MNTSSVILHAWGDDDDDDRCDCDDEACPECENRHAAQEPF